LDAAVLTLNRDAARKLIDLELRRRKIVATHYQNVDGTSFAAPITASIVALMLEANSKLTPAVVKNILISSASRLGGHPAIRQGFGLVNAAMALRLARAETHRLEEDRYHPPRVAGREILFRFHDDSAESVRLVGEFSDWNSGLAFERCGDGLWKLAVPCRPAGKYRYKFLIDESRWTEDPSHGLKEEDGYGGFNSVLLIS
jgi:serine protease AprX